MEKKLAKELLYELVMFTFAILVGVLLYYEYFVTLSIEQKLIVKKLDLIILSVFIFDYLFRFIKADSKKTFMKQNIIDLISIIPFDMLFRTIRLLRLLRVLRIIRIVKSVIVMNKNIKIILEILRTNDLFKIFQVTLLLILLSALGIFLVEKKINNIGDALWWAIVTATTVGYGDFSPSTFLGRCIAAVLMIAGIGTIGMLTGSIATFFLKRNNVNDDLKEIIISKINNLEELSEKEYLELLELIRIKKGIANEPIKIINENEKINYKQK